MAAQGTPTDVPEPRPRKEHIIFLNKAASRQSVLSWRRVTFKIHTFCRFDTPINLESFGPFLPWSCAALQPLSSQVWAPVRWRQGMTDDGSHVFSHCTKNGHLVPIWFSYFEILSELSSHIFLVVFMVPALFFFPSFVQPFALIFLFALFHISSAGCNRCGASLPRCHWECKFRDVLSKIHMFLLHHTSTFCGQSNRFGCISKTHLSNRVTQATPQESDFQMLRVVDTKWLVLDFTVGQSVSLKSIWSLTFAEINIACTHLDCGPNFPVAQVSHHSRFW